jgi:hypothetical protein
MPAGPPRSGPAGKPCGTGPSAPICIATGTVAGTGTGTTPGHVPSVPPDDTRGIPKIWVRAVREPKARPTDREHLDRGVHLGDENRQYQISTGRPAGLPPADDGHARAGRRRARTAAQPGYATNKGMTPRPVRRRKEHGTGRVFVGTPIGQSTRPTSAGGCSPRRNGGRRWAPRASE